MNVKFLRGVGLVLACILMLASYGLGLGSASAAPKGKGSSVTSTTALNKTSATRQVTTALITLFNSNDKNEKAREGLIQEASKYKADFVKLFSSAVAKSNPVVAQVTNVGFPGSAACRTAVKVPVCAAVMYNLQTATTGSTLLTGLSAYAVYVGGKWLVSDVTFCALAKLAKASC